MHILLHCRWIVILPYYNNYLTSWFTRVVGPDDQQAKAWITIALEMDWKRVGLSLTPGSHWVLVLVGNLA